MDMVWLFCKELKSIVKKVNVDIKIFSTSVGDFQDEIFKKNEFTISEIPIIPVIIR